MAETRRMTAEEGVGFLRESLRWVVQQLMEAEVSELIGAEHGERAPERLAHRSGYRARRWDARAGEIELAIAKIRCGSQFPSFLVPRRRSEQALVSVIQQAYVCGVSTRKVDRLGAEPHRPPLGDGMIELRTEDVDPRDPRRVEYWRRDYARSLGFDETAVALVAGTRIDLHAIEALTERGCPPDIALELIT